MKKINSQSKMIVRFTHPTQYIGSHADTIFVYPHITFPFLGYVRSVKVYLNKSSDFLG